MEWRETIYITNSDLWQQVQSKIYDSFHTARIKDDGQKGLKEGGSEITEVEEINIDDIPENLGEET